MIEDLSSDLLERAQELAEMDACLAAAAHGQGSLAIVEGVAGIGKTSLVEAARRRAMAAGLTVLQARGGQLEQDFAFGLVRQLLEPKVIAADEQQRQRWFAGAAASAAAVVDPRQPSLMTVSEPTFRHLHSLYWLLANLADDAPLAVVIDDAQLADAPSARFLSFLAPRLAHLGVAVILAARPEAREIAPLLLDPLARVLRPGPLSPAAVAEWLSGALRSPAAEVFARACREATGGNPFLLRELVREIALEGIVPDATQAPRVRSVSPRGVATAVLLRLGGVGPAAAALAKAVAVLENVTARVAAGRPELTKRLDVELLACTSTSVAVRIRLTRWRDRRLQEPRQSPRTGWEHLTLATLSLDAALSGQPTSRTQDLADRALAGLGLLADGRLRGQVQSMAGLSYMLIDHFDRAGELFEGLVQTTAQLVLAGTHSGMLAQRASLHLRCGRLLEAEADAGLALELGDEIQGARSLLPRAAAVAISVAAERGTSPPEWLLAAEIDPDSLITRLLIHSRAELLLSRGQLEPAVAQLLAYGEVNLRLGWEGPATPWRSQAALALAQLGKPGRARQLIGEELEVAQRQGTPRSIGVALRAAGMVATGQQRSGHLSHAVEVLEDSGARLEYARALVTLGTDRRQRGRAVSARQLLRSGHDLAVRCQADRLAQTGRAELRLAGARPRRNAFTGPGSLTPGERRVVDLVASGMSNRQVAQALFLTEKTVETHLGHVYAKLGIRSRRELAPILTAELALAAYHETGELGDAEAG